MSGAPANLSPGLYAGTVPSPAWPSSRNCRIEQAQVEAELVVLAADPRGLDLDARRLGLEHRRRQQVREVVDLPGVGAIAARRARHASLRRTRCRRGPTRSSRHRSSPSCSASRSGTPSRWCGSGRRANRPSCRFRSCRRSARRARADRAESSCARIVVVDVAQQAGRRECRELLSTRMLAGTSDDAAGSVTVRRASRRPSGRP